ncbi:MAG TPA: universal stress protein [Ferruginibacter sp.]|nr:universal stress protein [Ferruginibacter sp.]
MKTLFVATDFSANALNAAIYATNMAKDIHASILLFHVTTLPVNYGEIPGVVQSDEMMHEANALMTTLIDQLNIESGHSVEIQPLIKMGIFNAELQVSCAAIKPYAVIMGTQGSTSTERLMFGSHTLYAARNLDWPFIGIPPGVTYKPVKKIALACDFRQINETMPLETVQLLTKDFDAALYILHSGDMEQFNPEKEFSSGRLRDMLSTLHPVFHFINTPDVDTGIMNFVQHQEVDWLIVLPKKHGFLDRILHKSHTSQLLLHCRVPVIALHQHSSIN